MTTPLHISRVRVGDTVVVQGVPRTVCPADLKLDAFMGISLFGDSYRLGTLPVLVVSCNQLQEPLTPPKSVV